LRELIKPQKIKIDENTFSDTYAKFIIEPLERGFGTTLGNSLRRVLFSSIPGAAVVSVNIEGVSHEFSTIRGVTEDVLQIFQNLKKIRVKLQTDERELYLEAIGPTKVKAGDFSPDSEVEIVNPELLIANVTSDKTRLSMRVTLAQGKGYVEAAENKRKDQPIGTIPMDSIFTPVVNVSYQVIPARIGRKTNFDSLVMEISTDGTVRPDQALREATKILIEYFNLFTTEIVSEEKVGAGVERKEGKEFLEEGIEEINIIGSRLEALKKTGILQIKDLVSKTSEELLKIPNFGQKSLARVEKKLAESNLSLSRKEKETQ